MKIFMGKGRNGKREAGERRKKRNWEEERKVRRSVVNKGEGRLDDPS